MEKGTTPLKLGDIAQMNRTSYKQTICFITFYLFLLNARKKLFFCLFNRAHKKHPGNFKQKPNNNIDEQQQQITYYVENM